MPLFNAEKCEGCGGDSYHYAGCTIGGHGEIFLACNRWIERAYESTRMARHSDSFARLPEAVQRDIDHALVDLKDAYERITPVSEHIRARRK